MQRNLASSRFVITGVAGALGQNLALNLGKRGAHIIGFDKDKAELKALEKKFLQEKISAQLSALDITNAKAVEKAMLPLTKAPLTGLILNAGITRISFFEEQKDADFERVFAVNFFAATRMARLLLEPLRKAHGIIVGLSSVSGFAPLKKRTAYSASKHALAGFLESLRTEEDALDVLVVYPSFIASKIRDGGTEKPLPKNPQNLLSAEDAAEKICHAIMRRKKRVYLPFEARLAHWVWFFFPNFFIRLMKRRS